MLQAIGNTKHELFNLRSIQGIGQIQHFLHFKAHVFLGQKHKGIADSASKINLVLIQIPNIHGIGNAGIHYPHQLNTLF